MTDPCTGVLALSLPGSHHLPALDRTGKKHSWLLSCAVSIQPNQVFLQWIVNLLKLLWESAVKERSSVWTRLYHDRPVISSAEYPKKYKALKKKEVKVFVINQYKNTVILSVYSGDLWMYLSDSWVKVISSLWTLLKLWQRSKSELRRRLTVGVQRATNRGWLVGQTEEVDRDRGKDWKLPVTIMEQQLPCCSLKALEVCMQHIKLLSEER